MSLASIQEEIPKLDPQERAMLIDLLWESLDEARIKEIEAKWVPNPKSESTRSIAGSCPLSTALPLSRIFVRL